MKKIDKKMKKQWKTPILKELNTKLTLSLHINGSDGGTESNSAISD